MKKIEDKLKNDGNYKYDSVILRVGTNDLAYADKVAKNMGDLFNEVKPPTMKTAVSSVIFGYTVCSHSNHIELKPKVFLSSASSMNDHFYLKFILIGPVTVYFLAETPNAMCIC